MDRTWRPNTMFDTGGGGFVIEGFADSASDPFIRGFWVGDGVSPLVPVVQSTSNKAAVTATDQGDIAFTRTGALKLVGGDMYFEAVGNLISDDAPINGLWKRDAGTGDVTLLVSTDMVPGGETGRFLSLSLADVNAEGQVAFQSSLFGVGKPGYWVRNTDGTFDRVVQVDDIIKGRMVNDLPDLEAQLDMDGSLAFIAEFAASFFTLPDERGVYIGAVPVPDQYFWRGLSAADDNWHTVVTDESNWEDELMVVHADPPGAAGDERVTIGMADVVLDAMDVNIGSLTATGSLRLSKSLTLNETSSVQALTIENLPAEMGARLVANADILVNGLNMISGVVDVTTDQTVTLTGTSTWSEGLIHGTIANDGTFAVGAGGTKTLMGSLSNSGTMTIDDSLTIDDASGVLTNEDGGTMRWFGGLIEGFDTGSDPTTQIVDDGDFISEAGIVDPAGVGDIGGDAAEPEPKTIKNIFRQVRKNTTYRDDVVHDRVRLLISGTGKFRQEAKLTLKNNSTITNSDGGVYTLHGAAVLDQTESGPFYDSLNAVFEKTGTGAAEVRVRFNTTESTQKIKEGSLKLDANGVHEESVFRISPGASLRLEKDQALKRLVSFIAPSGQVQTGILTLPEGARVLSLDGSTVKYELKGMIGKLQIEGAEIGGTGDTTIKGNAEFISGKVSGRDEDGSGGISGGVVLEADEFKILAGGTKTIEGHLGNKKNVVQTSDLTLGTMGIVINHAGGVWDMQSGMIGPAGTGEFVNVGTFKKSTGSGTTTVKSDYNNQGSGKVDVDAGTLILERGTHSGGTYEVASGATLVFKTGNTEVTGTVAGSGAGTVKFQSGAVGMDSYVIKSGGHAQFNMSTASGLLFDGAQIKIEDNGVLTNAGQAKWVSGKATSAGTGKIMNTGTLVFDDAASTLSNPLKVDTNFQNKGGLVEVKADTHAKIDRDAMSLIFSGADASSFLLKPDTMNTRWEVQNGSHLTLDSKLTPSPNIVGLGEHAKLVFHGTGRINNLPAKTVPDGESSFVNNGEIFLVDNSGWFNQRSYSQSGAKAKLVIESGSTFHAQSHISENTFFQIFGGELRVDGDLVIASTMGFTGIKPITTFRGRSVKVLGSGKINGKSVDSVGGEITAAINFEDGATIAAGNSAGTLTIDGDVFIDARSMIEVEVGGVGPGVGYDQLVISGDASLSGVVAVRELDGFDPAAGSTLDVVVADTIVDGSVNLAHLSGGFFTPGVHDGVGTQSVRLTAVTPVVYAGVSGDWTTEPNWSGGAEPTDMDAAYLPGDAVLDTTVVGPTGGGSVGSLTVGSGDDVSMTTLSLNDSTVTVTHGVTLRRGSRLVGEGTVVGGVYNAGEVGPGSSEGVIHVTGHYVHTSDGVLAIELSTSGGGTPVAGADFDQLNVGGSAGLGGTLAISPLPDGDSFSADLGTLYPVMTFADRGGTLFDSVAGSLLSTGFALAPVFGDTDLTLRVSMPGDVNFDDKVSVADLSKFALNFGTTPGIGNWGLGDFNADGEVSLADLSLLALNFGFDLGAGEPATGLSLDAAARLAGINPAALPEPGVIGVVILGGLVVPWRRRSGV